MPSLFYLPKVVSLPGSKLYFYQTATSTPQDVFTDEDLSVAHSQPVVADGAGVFAPIYLDPTLPDYRVTHDTSANVLIYTVDDVPSNQNVQQSMRLESTNPFVFLYDTDGTSGSRKFRVRAAGAAFEVQSSNEAESVFTTILKYEAGILYSNATEVAVTESGSFTGTLTGMTASVTGTVNYRRVNNLVTLYLTSVLSGTSNTTAMTLTGMPAAIYPTGFRSAITEATDNGNSVLSLATVDSSGVVSFNVYSTSLVANRVSAIQVNPFTNSGGKGLSSGWTLTYAIS